jgi:hypothetical protein
MSEAAPQAALTDADRDALVRLRYGWGDAYRIGWNVRRGWWARRRDGIGGDITAAGVDGLWNAIREDYAQKSVPRDAGLKASP